MKKSLLFFATFSLGIAAAHASSDIGIFINLSVNSCELAEPVHFESGAIVKTISSGQGRLREFNGESPSRRYKNVVLSDSSAGVVGALHDTDIMAIHTLRAEMPLEKKSRTQKYAFQSTDRRVNVTLQTKSDIKINQEQQCIRDGNVLNAVMKVPVELTRSENGKTEKMMANLKCFQFVQSQLPCVQNTANGKFNDEPISNAKVDAMYSSIK